MDPAVDLLGFRLGNFALTRVLGNGGMGIVFLAEHAFIDRKKAIKVLRPEAAENPNLVRRFFDEATAATACRHDHIVCVDDCGTFAALGQAFHFIEMEFLEGMSVGDALRPPHAQHGRFEDLTRAVKIAAYAADALAAAHERGIVHRDVKPDNLFLTRRGARTDYVKVLDFGIARLTGDLAPGARTRTGAVLGTPEYMSPEQALGLHPDGKSDVFSLGVVLYRMVCGALPFRADTFSVLALRITREAAPSLRTLRPGVAPGLVRAIERAMDKNPQARPSMRTLRDLLLKDDAAPQALDPELSIAPPYRDATPADPVAAAPEPDPGHLHTEPDGPSARRRR